MNCLFLNIFSSHFSSKTTNINNIITHLNKNYETFSYYMYVRSATEFAIISGDAKFA